MYKLRAPKDFEKPYEGTFLGYEVEPGECIDVATDRERRFFKRLFFEDVKDLPKREDVKRLLVVMQGGLGDTLFATPGIRALKEQKPEVEITICTWNIGSSAIKHNPYIDSRLYTVDTELSLHFSDFDEVIDFGRVINSRPEAEYTNAYDIYSEHFETLFDIQVEDKKPLYYLTDEEKIKARNVLIDNGVKATDKVVGLVDQSSSLTRSWP